MSRSRRIPILVIVGILSLGIQHSFATPTLEISTSKSVYEYGDFLSINFNVSELTGKDVIIHIVDSSSKTSAPIDLSIYNRNTTITSPYAFYKTIYSPGTYHIEAEYSGSNATTSFNIIDSGKIAIPVELKTIVNHGDYEGLIRELINDNIINVANYNNQTNQIAYIPQWFKNSANWWSEGLTSDNEFGSSIQYLIQKGIIII
ncbi:MAG: hypothetical protein P4K92_01265 [Candidatus Nitrosotalea sp.]|nr:hypothetical protein [Candidatus Nitrosotalea sp.]